MGTQRGVNVNEQEFNTIKFLLSLGKSYADVSKACNRSKWVLSHVNTSKSYADYVRKKDVLRENRKKAKAGTEIPVQEKTDPEPPAADVWASRADADGSRAMQYNYQFNRLMKEMDRIGERLDLIQRTMTALLDVWKEG